MKRTVAVVLSAGVMASLSAGCSGGGGTERAATSTASSSAPSGANQGYASAEGVSDGLNRAGINCTQFAPGNSTGSSTGACGPIDITVWPTQTRAALGVDAIRKFYETTNKYTGDTDFFIHQDNWLVQTDDQPLAEEIVTKFGGTVEAVRG